MNGMIDFYLQTCLGWSYSDAQLFSDTNLESWRRKINTFSDLQTLGKTPDSLSLRTASQEAEQGSGGGEEWGIQPAQVLAP